MVLTRDEIFDMKKAITLYDSFRNFFQDPNGQFHKNRKGNTFARQVRPVIELLDKSLDDVLTNFPKPRHLPEPHRNLLKKLIRNPSKIITSYALFSAGGKNIDNLIVERDRAIFDVMPELYAYRDGQTKKGRTEADILAFSLGIHPVPTD